MKKLLFSAAILVFCIACLGSCNLFKKDTPCEHNYVEKIVAPTCVAEGYTEYTCKECGNSYRDIFTQKVAHPYRDTVVNPTCTTEGYTEHICSVCGDNYRDEITQKTTHSYRDNVVSPTCTTEGYTEHICTVCGDKYTDSTTQKVSHNYKSVVVSPTCTEEGYTNHICEICEVSYQDTVTKKIPHTYEAEIFVPDCTKEGYTLHTCSECGDNYTDNITEKTAHRFNGAPCIYCSKEEITEGFDANTDWYNADLVSVTLTTAEELAGLAALVNSGTSFSGMTIYLGADIDLEYREWTPIGNTEYAFDGTFSGEGFKIKGLKINACHSYVGLFGNATGKISDFTVSSSSIYVPEIYDYVSIVCGYSTSEISNVSANGFIDATHSNYVGAICGYLTVGISNCSANAYIFGGSYVGGIAGCSNVSSAVYSNLTYNGTVSGSEYTGGIIGNITATGSLQTNILSFTGSVIGTKRVGGIVGYIAGAVGSQLYAASVSANITGECYVGGIAGEASSVAINACSNAGSTITATLYETVDSTMYAYVGGYVGKGYSVDGAVNTADIKYNLRGMYVGGIAGYLNHSATNCENSGDISGYDYVGGIVGRLESTVAVTIGNLKNSSDISGNNYVGGIFGEYKNTANMNLLNLENSGNITATGYDVGGIAGVCNNSGKTLIAENLKNTGNVTVADNSVGGLFGYAEGNTSSVIKNCESSGAISGKYYVGGLVGNAVNVTITSCSNEGSTLTATGWYTESSVDYVWLGGYVGKGYNVTECTNNTDINYLGNGRYIGGIAGYINYITDCTNNGNITTTSGYVGGIAGCSYGNVSNCVNNGDISSVGSNVGGIAGELSSSNAITYENLTNNGNISATSNAGGVVGAIRNVISAKGTWYEDVIKRTYGYNKSQYHRYRSKTTMINFVNNGNVTATENNAGGIIGYAYFESTYLLVKNHSGTCQNASSNDANVGWCEFVGNLMMTATVFSNNGAISGTENIGQLIGYFDSDCMSTLTTYTVTGTVNINGSVLEGDNATGEAYDLTLSDKVIPEVEDNTENE